MFTADAETAGGLGLSQRMMVVVVAVDLVLASARYAGIGACGGGVGGQCTVQKIWRGLLCLCILVATSIFNNSVMAFHIFLIVEVAHIEPVGCAW